MKINAVSKTISLLLVLTLLFGVFTQPVMASSKKGNKHHNKPEHKAEKIVDYVTITGLMIDNVKGQTILEISTWGEKYYINYEEYIEFVEKNIYLGFYHLTACSLYSLQAKAGDSFVLVFHNLAPHWLSQ